MNAIDKYPTENPTSVVAEEANSENATDPQAVSEHTTNDETPPALELTGGAADAPCDLTQAKLILEAALLSSNEPLQLADLKKLFDQELSIDTIRRLLDELKADWSNRAIELTPVASGWRFRVKPE